MTLLLIILICIVLVVIILQIVAFIRNGRKAPEEPKAPTLDAEGLKLILEQMNSQLNNQLNNINVSVDQKMSNIGQSMSENMHRQFSESRKIVSDVTEKLTKLDETNREVVGFTKQLQDLQDILKNPKQRGILGEYYLETLLKNVMPPGSYEMQYSMHDKAGEGSTIIVDAVVHVKDKIIPIDSKFSLENYNRLVAEKDPLERERLEKAFKGDLKNRIDETSKYVQPSRGTMDFAFMFIPHEAIYYDLLVAEVGGMKINTHDLIDYAFKKRVLIVSPTSFLAFLQTVLQGLKALQIEETHKDVIKRVEELSKHLKSFEEYHKKLGTSLGTVVSHFNSSNKEFRKIDKDVTRIAGLEDGMAIEVDSILLEKPEIDD